MKRMNKNLMRILLASLVTFSLIIPMTADATSVTQNIYPESSLSWITGDALFEYQETVILRRSEGFSLGIAHSIAPQTQPLSDLNGGM